MPFSDIGSLFDVDVDIDEGYHSQFDKLDTDIVFISSDDIKFRLYQKYLGSLAEGLAVDGLQVDVEEPVELSETGATLEVLFQFLVPQKFPDLADLPFNLLADVAEAAEKYLIFAAMNVCSIRMLGFAEDYPIDVLVYALKHGYKTIANIAAKCASCHPLKKVIRRIHPQDAAQWALYHERFREIFRSVRRSYTPLGIGVMPKEDLKTSRKLRRVICAEWYSALSLEISRLEGLEEFRELQEELSDALTIELARRANHDSRCRCVIGLQSFEEVFSVISMEIEAIPPFIHVQTNEEEELSEDYDTEAE